ncbi:aldehyde dehydrogenase family protein [Aliikangiella sp. IMCC44632]
MQPVLIEGQWRPATAVGQFQADNPSSGEKLSQIFPISSWDDCEQALNSAVDAQQKLATLPAEKIAEFLEVYASKIEQNRAQLVSAAHLETGLAETPRLNDVELPRTVNQLRQAADAARHFSWCHPVIDRSNNIRSVMQPIGVVAIFGPNNFPFAFGSASGGDFAAAIAAGNAVIIKAHPCHPYTTKLFTELAFKAAVETGLPTATVQMIYALDYADGLKLVADSRLGATAFTGSRAAGLALKKAADEAGNLIYLELSSINPVVLLEQAVEQNAESIAEQFVASCTLAAGQLCTKPGLLFVSSTAAGDQVVSLISKGFNQAANATLLTINSSQHLQAGANQLIAAGAQVLAGNQTSTEPRFSFANTLLSVSIEQFLENSELMQQELFGNAALIVRYSSIEQVASALHSLQGNLTGSIYIQDATSDEEDYQKIEPVLCSKVGRVINNKMPTGVAVSSAMNHGGPYPASGHAGFSAVGFPASIKRFAAIKCFDNVPESRLPLVLKNRNPQPKAWRLVDGEWTQRDIQEN